MWQPIETAPKDGTQFLAVSTMPEMFVARWYQASDGSAFWIVFYSGDLVMRHPYPLTKWWDFGDGRAMPDPPT